MSAAAAADLPVIGSAGPPDDPDDPTALGRPEPAPPRRGRPRSADADQRILDATLDLAAEVGIYKMSMDDVAQRAGASKATIYRRWSSKEALVLDAMRHAIQAFDRIDTGSVRGDLATYLRELSRKMTRRGATDLLPHLIESAACDESLRASLDEYVQHRRQPLTTIFERGIERGELPADTDVGLLVDFTIGPIIYRHLLTHAPLDPPFTAALLSHILGSSAE